MIKQMFQPIMIVVFCIGCMYMILSYTDKMEYNKSAGWPTAPGKLIDSGDAMKGRGLLRLATGYHPATLLTYLITTPYAKYSYEVRGEHFQEEKSGLPCISVVRMWINRDKLGKDPEVKTISSTNDSNMHITYDPKTGEPRFPDTEQMMEMFATPITVRYDPTDHTKSVLDADVLRNSESLLGSGVFLAGLSAIILGLMRFHAYMTAPGPEPTVYGGRSLKKY